MKFYVTLIYTNKYSGNFEREMLSFCTGLKFPRGSEYVMKQEHTFWEDNVYEYNIEQHEDHWEEACAIFPNPDYRNDGVGGHYKNKDKYKFPAFMAAGVFTIKEPPKEIIMKLKKDAIEFTKLYKNYDHYGYENYNDFIIEGVGVVEMKTGETNYNKKFTGIKHVHY